MTTPDVFASAGGPFVFSFGDEAPSDIEDDRASQGGSSSSAGGSSFSSLSDVPKEATKTESKLPPAPAADRVVSFQELAFGFTQASVDTSVWAADTRRDRLALAKHIHEFAKKARRKSQISTGDKERNTQQRTAAVS